MALHLTPLEIAGILLSFAVLAAGLKTRSKRKALPLPPGPPRLPLIGNLLNFPRTNQQQKFTEWSVQYGDVIYSQVLGQDIITINSPEPVEELLTKRAGNSSNRPHMVMASELVGMGWALLFKQPGPDHREERRLLHAGLSPAGLKKWANMVDDEASKFVRAMVYGRDRDLAVEDFVAAVIFIHSYGDGVFKAHGKELLDMNKHGIMIFSETLANFWLVDIMPFLRHLPDWFPGTAFKKVAAKHHKFEEVLQVRPFEVTKQLYDQGSAGESITAQLLDQGADHDRVRTSVGTAFQAGYEATYVSVTVFILAMLLYPDVQKKAQAEIDALTNGERIPTLADRPNLPYINAMCKEIKRWHTIGPLGVPHVFAEEDEYKGMRIPKGAIVQTNVRLIHHNPKYYPDPYTFRPERFLPENPSDMPLDPSLFAFGFGRRMCPGRHLADMTTFSAMINILTAYSVQPAPGKPVPTDLEYIDGTVSLPKAFDCKLAPRSEKALQLFRDYAPE